jgi:hypothetical protein
MSARPLASRSSVCGTHEGGQPRRGRDRHEVFPSQPDPEGHPGCCPLLYRHGRLRDEAVEDRPRGDSVERRRAGGREALAHPVGEVVDDRDGAFDALGGSDQVWLSRAEIRERTVLDARSTAQRQHT